MDSQRLIDLAEASFVLGDEEAYGAFRQSIFELCNNRGFHPRIELIVSNTIGIFGMVAAGVARFQGFSRRTGLAVGGVRAARGDLFCVREDDEVARAHHEAGLGIERLAATALQH